MNLHIQLSIYLSIHQFDLSKWVHADMDELYENIEKGRYLLYKYWLPILFCA